MRGARTGELGFQKIEEIVFGGNALGPSGTVHCLRINDPARNGRPFARCWNHNQARPEVPAPGRSPLRVFLAHLPRPYLPPPGGFGLPPRDLVPVGLTRYVLPPVGLPPYDFVPVGFPGYGGFFGGYFLPPPSFFLPLPFFQGLGTTPSAMISALRRSTAVSRFRMTATVSCGYLPP